MNSINTPTIEYFDEIVSTNEYVKLKRGEGRDFIAVAKRQTGGRGTKGRSFISEVGGVYLSRLCFPQQLLAKDAFSIMAGAAVAVCKTLSRFRLQPVIKWANDIYVNDKKICGILIENVFSGNLVRSSIVGIGLNVCNELPNELLPIATTMQQAAGKKFSVDEVCSVLIEELSKQYSMEEYQAYLGYMGRVAQLIMNDESIPATLVCVDDEGGLVVDIEGQRRRLSAAEVSLKLE